MLLRRRLLLGLMALGGVFAPLAFAKSEPIVINIDNPQFRKLRVALPSFATEPKADPSLAALGVKASQELSRLMEFTGYFDVMAAVAYQSLLTAAPAKTKLAAIPGFPEVDLVAWKGVGVESLTLGKIIKSSQGALTIEFRTADIDRGQQVLGKAFTIAQADDLDTVLKQYVDRLLEAYTGKPGIFSTKIAFIGRRSKQSEKQLFICDIDGSHVRQLTHTPAVHVSPSWNPDGTKILFTSYESGNPDLYLIDITTNKVEKVSGHKGLNVGGGFTPNGQLIAYSGSSNGKTELYLKRLNGAERVPLLQGEKGMDVDPAFSPDGKWLAFVSGRFVHPHIFRAELKWSADGSQVQVVGDKRLTYAGWWNVSPAWSPDSQKIAFAGFDRDIGRFDLFMMNHDGTQLERLTLRLGDNENPSWSPNGQLILFSSNRVPGSDRKGLWQLYLMNRDGSHQRMIPTGLYEADSPKWGPYLLK